MATADDHRDTSVRPPGSKYPWDEWQNGKWWTAKLGEDFDCTPRAFRDQLHVRARATDSKVRTRTNRKDTVQFTFKVKSETEEQFGVRAKENRAAEQSA